VILGMLLGLGLRLGLGSLLFRVRVIFRIDKPSDIGIGNNELWLTTPLYVAACIVALIMWFYQISLLLRRPIRPAIRPITHDNDTHSWPAGHHNICVEYVDIKSDFFVSV
jgi:hypothetical protein